MRDWIKMSGVNKKPTNQNEAKRTNQSQKRTKQTRAVRCYHILTQSIKLSLASLKPIKKQKRNLTKEQIERDDLSKETQILTNRWKELTKPADGKSTECQMVYGKNATRQRHQRAEIKRRDMALNQR